MSGITPVATMTAPGGTAAAPVAACGAGSDAARAGFADKLHHAATRPAHPDDPRQPASRSGAHLTTSDAGSRDRDPATTARAAPPPGADPNGRPVPARELPESAGNETRGADAENPAGSRDRPRAKGGPDRGQDPAIDPAATAATPLLAPVATAAPANRPDADADIDADSGAPAVAYRGGRPAGSSGSDERAANGTRHGRSGPDSGHARAAARDARAASPAGPPGADGHGQADRPHAAAWNPLADGRDQSAPVATSAPAAVLAAATPTIGPVPGSHAAATPLIPTGQAPATGVLYAPIGSAPWQQELGEQFIRFAQAGTSNVELELNPKDLGPLRISLHVGDQVAQVHCLAAHADVCSAVQQAIPQLREALAGHGIALGQATVGQQQQRHDQPGARRPAVRGEAAPVGAIGGGVARLPAHVRGALPTLANGVDLYA